MAAEGTGEHSTFFAEALPDLDIQPTELDPAALEIIEARRHLSGLPNLRAPVRLDAADPASWAVRSAAAVVAINMVHISPWAATEGLVEGAGRILPPGGVLFLYGPYREAGVPTAPSNEAFDASLRARDPAWGLRDREVVEALAGRHGLALSERVEMPANNLSLVFRKA